MASPGPSLSDTARWYDSHVPAWSISSHFCKVFSRFSRLNPGWLGEFDYLKKTDRTNIVHDRARNGYVGMTMKSICEHHWITLWEKSNGSFFVNRRCKSCEISQRGIYDASSRSIVWNAPVSKPDPIESRLPKDPGVMGTN